MRAIWRGHIRFSLVTIPIRIYNAIDTAETIRFNQLHKDCNGNIGYDKRCKKCDEKVKNDDIVKGYKYEPDQYVIIEKEDLDNLKLKSTKIIEIEGFVDASEVHHTLFDAPYFAGPDGEVASTAYALLCETLKRSNKLGIGKVVLRDRESVMLMAPHSDGGLVLYKLRYPHEVRDIKDVPQLESVAADEDQLKLAQTKRSGFPVKDYFIGVVINPQPTPRIHLMRPVQGWSSGATQDGFHPGHQLARAERLGDVIVCAHLES